MANTKIPVELSSTPGIVDGSNATAVTITSDEDFLVRQTSADVYDTNSGSTKREFWGNQFSGSNNTASKTIIGSASNLPLVGGSTQNASSKFIVNSYIGFGSSDQTAGGEDGFMAFFTSSGGAAGTEKMRIDNSGNVGIGTSSPNGKLTISNSGAGGFEFTPDTTAFSVANSNYIASYDRSASAYRDIVFDLGGAESQSVRFKAGGNVGIGTSSPSSKLHVYGGAILVDNGSSAGTIYFHDTTNYINLSSDALQFANNGAERVRIDSSGNLLIGTTTTRTGTSSLSLEQTNSYIQFRQTGSSAVAQIQFFRNTDSTATFSGGIISTGTSVSYETTSDYRLKENVNYNFDALTRVKELKPARFNFIVDADKTVDGFLAHEVSDIVPEAITGEKDAVDDEGNPEYQGIDQSKLVPLLTKAIQEQQELIETQQTTINDLKSRIETLEG